MVFHAHQQLQDVDGIRAQVALDLGITGDDGRIFPELLGQGTFSGLEGVRLVPFSRKGTISGSNVALGPARLLPPLSSEQRNMADIGSFHAHLYPYAEVYLPMGTSSVLMYGHAPLDGSTPAQKHLYGSLQEPGMDGMSLASDISFAPDPICSGGFPAAAAAM